MRRLGRVTMWACVLLFACFFLLTLEASGGHDGYLCEWGIDTDGDGDLVTGCG